MKFYNESTEKVLSEVGSSELGLSNSEAEKRLAENGKNKLAEGEKDSLFKRFLNELKDPMLIMLMVAALVSGITSVMQGHGEYADVIIIMIVVILNASLGVYQESKAEKAIEALQQMAAATSKVLRDGKIVSLKSEDLVVGDIILLEAGDAVPADGRIIENASLKIEEAALTGESVPVSKMIDILGMGDNKEVSLGDRKNMVYMGSIVVYGRGKAVVCATGMDTEMGKIADALAKAEDGETPLQIKLGQLSKTLSYGVIAICVFVFIFSLVRAGNYEMQTVLNTFMIAVSLAVAAIPEGLATVVTIVLSIGVTNMSKRNAIIRKLTAVETLGCAQIICSDKTGTLTQNKMTVVDHYSDNQGLLARAMALASDAELENSGIAVGEPTEVALVNYANKLNLNKNELKKQEPRIGEAPFDSSRKMMSTVHNTKDGIIQYTKGAPDEILKRCTQILDGGNIRKISEEDKNNILKTNKTFADRALRILAVAYKSYDIAPTLYEAEALENDLIFVGLAGMIDPVRPEVLGAVEDCKKAGIRPIMITGDHKDTAIAIAMELRIITDSSQAITGAEINNFSDEEFKKVIGNYSVYARVQPEHKVRIVKTWQENGFVTAMTGDGVNDAPSIKTADIGVGMGITGTDVTKNVADMVLTDDNFASIVGAVEEGRTIYDNIRKAIQFLLSSNLSEVISIFVASILNFVILKPVHLLWINLVTDTFPALALGMEPAEPGIMDRRPREKSESIFAHGIGFNTIYQGIMVSALTLAAYFIGHYIESGVWEIANSPDGMTMAFLTMNMAEVFHSFNMRSSRKSLFSLKKQNKYLYASLIGGLVLTTAVMYVPFLSKAFGLEHISLLEYAISILLGISVIPVVEFVKFIQRSRDK
jgi:Ca2+-transporting ATPase